MKKFSLALTLALLIALSPIADWAQADPLHGIEPTIESETVPAAIFEADVQIPDVYLKAKQLSPNQIEVSYSSTSPDAKRFQEAVQKNSDPAAEIIWKPETYSPSEQLAAGQLAMEEARRQGLDPSGATFDSEAKRFTVYVADSLSVTAKSAIIRTRMGDTSAEVVFETSKGDGPESRYSDGTPWKAGLALNFRAAAVDLEKAECTSNFAWKRWGTGEILSATANHCGNNFPNEVCHPGRTEAWFNDARAFGNLAFCNQTLDTQMLRRASTSHTFAPHMWHGPAATSSFGIVKYASVPVEDVRYYVSGANSGTRFATVVDANGIGIFGGPGVFMHAHVTQGGDSGAPWFSYLGSGGVAAIGLHSGRIGAMSVFTPLNPISAHFQASIHTG